MQHTSRPPLFELPPDDPPDNGTAASRDGAVAAKNRRARRRWLVLDAIKRAGWLGATNQELAERCELRESSVCSLTNELARLGLIERQRDRRFSQFADGSQSQVRHQAWQLATSHERTNDK